MASLHFHNFSVILFIGFPFADAAATGDPQSNG